MWINTHTHTSVYGVLAVHVRTLLLWSNQFLYQKKKKNHPCTTIPSKAFCYHKKKKRFDLCSTSGYAVR